jgi:ribosomal protein S14
MHWALSFHNSPRAASLASFRRACNLTYNPRSIFRLFKMNRHSVKRWVAQGRLQGMRKASF